jgi:hypothetical protein
MTLVQYQTCVSVLFAGYIGFQIPSASCFASTAPRRDDDPY